jgi:hypothetical protein
VSTRFKLETLDEDIFLWIPDAVRSTAGMLLWEEVVVRGTFNFESGLFEVERIFLVEMEEAEKIPADREIEMISREVAQRGALEPGLAS